MSYCNILRKALSFVLVFSASLSGGGAFASTTPIPEILERSFVLKCDDAVIRISDGLVSDFSGFRIISAFINDIDITNNVRNAYDLYSAELPDNYWLLDFALEECAVDGRGYIFSFSLRNSRVTQRAFFEVSQSGAAVRLWDSRGVYDIEALGALSE